MVRAPALLVAAAIAQIVAGCAPAPTLDFSVRKKCGGQVVWKIGDSAARSRIACEWDDAGNFRTRVYDDRPQLTIERFNGRWSIVGPAASGHWRGIDSAVPARLEGWLSLAEACDGMVAAADGVSEVRTGRFSVRYAKPNGRIKGIELVTLATGERFRAEFD